MTTPPSFPSLPGLAWSSHKKPITSTRVAMHVSGREVRVGLYAVALYEFEVMFDGLASSAQFPGLGVNSLQTLMGFFLQCQGQLNTFLFTDPTDSILVGQDIGIGDGATQAFVMSRTLGGWNEPVGWVTALTNVYLNGVVQASGVSLVAPNTLQFVTAPGSGVAITADFTFAFVCRLLADQYDFEQSMKNWWALKSLTFRSVKP
jgi:uncharacterized protein (TIGR02217 family)